MVDTPRQARPEINRVVSVGWRPTNWGRWNRYKERSPEKKKKNKVPEEKKVSKKRKCPRSQKVSKEVKQCKWTYRKEQWMNDDMCGWMFPLGVWGAGWYCNFSNIFWRSPLHCEKIVCCDVRCERRDLWKTSVTCTTICSQIDRGIPFSVYPSSAPHPGRYNLMPRGQADHGWRRQHKIVSFGFAIFAIVSCQPNQLFRHCLATRGSAGRQWETVFTKLGWGLIDPTKGMCWRDATARPGCCGQTNIRPGLSGTIGDMFGSVTSPDSCCSATTEEDGFTDGVVSDMRHRAWMRRGCLGSHQQHRQESAGSSPRQPSSGTVHPGHLATACPAIDGHSRSCVPAG